MDVLFWEFGYVLKNIQWVHTVCMSLCINEIKNRFLGIWKQQKKHDSQKYFDIYCYGVCVLRFNVCCSKFFNSMLMRTKWCRFGSATPTFWVVLSHSESFCFKSSVTESLTFIEKTLSSGMVFQQRLLASVSAVLPR